MGYGGAHRARGGSAASKQQSRGRYHNCRQQRGAEDLAWPGQRGHAPDSVAGTSAGHCAAQQRTLRRLFWLRGWSGVQVNVFRVPSADNPANPLSRLPSLASRAVGVHNTRCLLVKWLRYGHTPRMTPLPAFPWPLLRRGGPVLGPPAPHLACCI